VSEYAAPIDDMTFVLRDIVGLGRTPGLDGETSDPELVESVLRAAADLASGVLSPLNRVGDVEGARLENGVVRTPTGFREAYRRFVEGGWGGVPFAAELGGQGLPWVVAAAVQEMWQSANMAFGLCPLLTQAAIELIGAHGSAAQKQRYLPRLVSGQWTGSMNLTEPQAGSDLGQIRCRAVRQDDHYRLTGQKIFITYGEHDLAENIIHLVLARLPEAPAGTRGISLFIVPKFLAAGAGEPGTRNDLRCVSLEHKLGVHASPTAVMAFGDGGGAWGELVGEPHRGLEYMFTMMNNARLSVGLQGVAIAERAYQRALAYARARVQGRELGSSDARPVTILRHPDIRRMLMTMKAEAEAARALAYRSFAALDLAKSHPDAAARRRHQAELDLLTPVVKAWSTDLGVECASLGLQVHGGMGFIEESGAAQHWRDARIAPIYEGTNGIQARDLVFRKLGADGGAAAESYFASVAGSAKALARFDGDDPRAIASALELGLAALRRSSAHLIEIVGRDPRQAEAGAASYLRQFGCVAGGHAIALAATACLDRPADRKTRFHAAKLACARFFADHVLSQAPALTHAVVAGGTSVLALSDDQF
jgi:alkylation response protein AidB-like acyl-CoA dehydrogenase